MTDKRVCDSPIGVLDSGMGGISTLKTLVAELPHENFIYYGDDKNAPYGLKTVGEVRMLAENAVVFLLERGAKAIVIACNTATGAAATYLREKYADIPIIGAEPAIKPAVSYHHRSRILVMATPLTLSTERFRRLADSVKGDCDIISLPCPGLVELVEAGKTEGDEVDKTLHGLLDRYVGRIDSIVLGCTHYPFLSKAISAIVGENVPLFDGNRGIAAETHRRLEAGHILSGRRENGSVLFETSAGDADTPRIARTLLGT